MIKRRSRILYFLIFFNILFFLIFSGSFVSALTDTNGNGYLEIHNCVELQAMQNNLAANYELMNNIDCSDTKNWNSGEGFAPIMGFTGNFNGNNNVISDLTILRTGQSSGAYNPDRAALFGLASGGANIHNVGMVNINFSTTWGFYAAGLVADVTGSDQSPQVYISNSYVTGNIYGRNGIGGLVGSASYVIVTNSYSTAKVTSAFSDGTGGLIGEANNKQITSSYWDNQISGQSRSVGGIGKTTAQMKTASTYVGWNNTLWNIANGNYPTLKNNLLPCTSFTYSNWSSCANNLQTRTLLTSSPVSCSGGNPILNQSCSICSSFTYSDWSTCSNDRNQTRAILSASPLGCSGGNPILNQSCDPICDSSKGFIYKDGTCVCDDTFDGSKRRYNINGTCSCLSGYTETEGVCVPICDDSSYGGVHYESWQMSDPTYEPHNCFGELVAQCRNKLDLLQGTGINSKDVAQINILSSKEMRYGLGANLNTPRSVCYTRYTYLLDPITVGSQVVPCSNFVTINSSASQYDLCIEDQDDMSIGTIRTGIILGNHVIAGVMLNNISCSQRRGKVCSEKQYCSGTEVNYSSSNRCCLGKCIDKPKTCNSCSECGKGGRLFEICDKAECFNSCGKSQGTCGFKPSIFGFGGTCYQKTLFPIDSCMLLDNSSALYQLNKTIDLAGISLADNSEENNKSFNFAKTYGACLVMSGDGIYLNLGGNNVSGEYNYNSIPLVQEGIVSSGDNQFITGGFTINSTGMVAGFPIGIYIQNIGDLNILNINTRDNLNTGIYLDNSQRLARNIYLNNFISKNERTGLRSYVPEGSEASSIIMGNVFIDPNSSIYFSGPTNLAMDKPSVHLPLRFYLDAGSNLTVLNSRLGENNYLIFKLNSSIDASNRNKTVLDAVTLSYLKNNFNFDADTLTYPELNVPTIVSTDKILFNSSSIALIQLNRAIGNPLYYTILNLNNPFQMILKGFDLCLDNSNCISKGKTCIDNRCVLA